jgi:hypothetical protein
VWGPWVSDSLATCHAPVGYCGRHGLSHAAIKPSLTGRPCPNASVLSELPHPPSCRHCPPKRSQSCYRCPCCSSVKPESCRSELADCPEQSSPRHISPPMLRRQLQARGGRRYRRVPRILQLRQRLVTLASLEPCTTAAVLYRAGPPPSAAYSTRAPPSQSSSESTPHVLVRPLPSFPSPRTGAPKLAGAGHGARTVCSSEEKNPS